MKTCWPVMALAAALAVSPAVAQQSASFKLEESVMNSGGSPVAGAALSSAGFQMRLSSLGEGLVAPTLSSVSFRVDAGFVQGLLPPVEVTGLVFTGAEALQWDAQPAAGTYNLYRGLQGDLAGLGYGTCEQQQLPGNGTTDGDPVPADAGFFYLVTAVNRLDEEGGKGFQSDGAERLGNICP